MEKVRTPTDILPPPILLLSVSAPPPPDDDWFRATLVREGNVIEEKARCRLWAVPASVSLGMRMPKPEGGRQRERGRRERVGI